MAEKDRQEQSDDGSEAQDEAPHCWSCGDRPMGCPRCADEDGVK